MEKPRNLKPADIKHQNGTETYERSEDDKTKPEPKSTGSQPFEGFKIPIRKAVHDLNNNLQRIISFAELVRDETSEDSSAHYYLEILLTTCVDAKELTDQILAYTRQ